MTSSHSTGIQLFMLTWFWMVIEASLCTAPSENINHRPPLAFVMDALAFNYIYAWVVKKKYLHIKNYLPNFKMHWEQTMYNSYTKLSFLNAWYLW